MRASRLDRLHSAVDRQEAEQVRIVPHQGGGYLAAGPDADRPVTIVQAYVARTPAAVRTSGNAANSGHNVELRAAADTIKFSTGALPYELRAGDVVEMIDQPDAPAFTVSRTAPYAFRRTVAFLVRIAAQ